MHHAAIDYIMLNYSGKPGTTSEVYSMMKVRNLEVFYGYVVMGIRIVDADPQAVAGCYSIDCIFRTINNEWCLLCARRPDDQTIPFRTGYICIEGAGLCHNTTKSVNDAALADATCALVSASTRSGIIIVLCCFACILITGNVPHRIYKNVPVFVIAEGIYLKRNIFGAFSNVNSFVVVSNRIIFDEIITPFDKNARSCVICYEIMI